MEYNDTEIKDFDYCDKVDLHALDQKVNFDRLALIANEHGFRGIVVPQINLDNLVKTFKIFEYKDILPICAIDYPFGSSSLDVRNYAIMSAKEKGAQEVEIVAPYHLIVSQDFRKLYDDAQGIANTCKKQGLKLKYVIDQNGPYLDDTVRSNLARMISKVRIPSVSTSLGFFDNKVDHSDNVIKMRTMKSKAGCSMKVYIGSQNVEDIASYIKAGADIIGLPWQKAVYLMHAYQDLVQKKY